jgi:hypothetical protein
MKTSAPRRHGDEYLRLKKTQRRRSTYQEDSDTKTSAPRRARDESSRIKKALETHLCAKKISEAKALGTKTYASRRS